MAAVPNTPTNGTRVLIRWDAVTSATSYKLSRDGVLIASGLTVTNYLDVVQLGSAHTYTVQSTDGGGDSAASSGLVVLAAGNYVPS